MAFTFFFRDSQTLELAAERLVAQAQGQQYIDVWDAGCAHGPEPYTLAMLLRERMSHFLFRNVRILATDIEAQFGPQITSGIYPQGEIQRIPSHYRERYFEPADRPGFVQVIEEVRSRIRFEHHDLLLGPPTGKNFDLIVCKNVLLHFGEETRERIVAMFHGALRAGGLLAMEHTQKLPEELAPHFDCVNSFAQLYRKAGQVATFHAPHVPAPHRPVPLGQPLGGPKPGRVIGGVDLQK